MENFFQKLEINSERDFLEIFSNKNAFLKLKNIIKEKVKNDFDLKNQYDTKCLELLLEIDMVENQYKDQFIQDNTGSEYHWFFIEGINALKNQLYIPSIVSFLCGIEASIRSILQIIDKKGSNTWYHKDIMKMDVLHLCLKNEIPIECLAFDQEDDFIEKIKNYSTNNAKKVEFLNIRNDICHGNLSRYIQIINGNEVFYPEFILSDLIQIIISSRKLLNALSIFKEKFYNGESA